MIVVVTGWFDIYDKHGYPTGKKEFSISHGIDLKSGRSIVMSGGHPTTVVAKFDTEMQEWVIYDYEEEFERICLVPVEKEQGRNKVHVFRA